jgi:hypothetical protein
MMMNEETGRMTEEEGYVYDGHWYWDEECDDE